MTQGATEMTLTQVSADLMVSDHDSAVAWYAQLLDREPDQRPMDGLAEWQITDTAWIQVVADMSKAGNSIVTIGVDDMDEHARRLRERDLELDRQTTPRGQHLGTIIDPDGNQIVFAQDLQDS